MGAEPDRRHAASGADESPHLSEEFDQFFVHHGWLSLPGDTPVSTSPRSQRRRLVVASLLTKLGGRVTRHPDGRMELPRRPETARKRHLADLLADQGHAEWASRSKLRITASGYAAIPKHEPQEGTDKEGGPKQGVRAGSAAPAGSMSLQP